MLPQPPTTQENAMREPATPFAGWLLYEDDELILDGEDPTTYIACETAEDISRALATLPDPRDPEVTAR